LKISALNANSIMVYGTVDDQFEIAKHINGATDQGTRTESIAVQSMEPTKAADMLKGMFGSDSKTGAPYIEANADLNAITVRGTEDQIRDVKAAMQAMGAAAGAGGPGGVSGNMRVITLEKGSAASLAEALNKLLPQMRKNPVKVIIPGSEN